MTATFDQFLSQLRQDREWWVAASQKNKFDRGIWNATVEKYADPTHFIFELLQNAEDQDATEVFFHLRPDEIVFEHNGKPFSRDDVEGITGIGNTTKIDQANKIGCFGIGFKSVYVLTQQPEVHCTIEGRPIAFVIRDLVVPELIPTTHCGTTTLFRLPLAPGSAHELLEKVARALRLSGARSLMFLSSVKDLHWSDGSEVGHCSTENGIGGIRTLTTVIGDSPAMSDRFLILSRQIQRDEDQTEHSVKIAFRLSPSGEIVPEPSATRVAVFFETEDLTGLHFQVHGPFQLTDNRANIKRGDTWNSRLIDEVATLLTESLPDLRNRGFIRRSFLEVMPNGNDELPEPWLPVLTSVITAFQQHALVPAHSGGHVAGSSAIRGPSDLRDALGDEGLDHFAALHGTRWVTTGLRSSRIDVFLSTIKVPEWGHTEFLASFQRAFTRQWYNADIQVAERAKAWFDALADDQVQRLYLVVDTASRAQKRPWLSQLPYVRLEDGTRAAPSEARLQPSGVADDEAAAHGLVLVRAALTRTRARGKDVEQFLRRVGVKEIGERDYLLAILSSQYNGNRPGPGGERHLQHMRRFLRYFSETRDATLFEDATIFRSQDAEGFLKASSVYLSSPFSQSALSRIYGGRVKGRTRRPLWEGYAKLKRNDLIAFAAATGVESHLQIEKTRVGYNHPKWASLTEGFGGTRITASRVSSDYQIEQLSGLVGLRDVEVARMVWKAVADQGVHCMYAHWAPNQTYQPNRELSSLALILQQTEWIPAKDGNFKLPRSITSPELMSGFPTSGNEDWLSVIEFSAEHRQRSEQHQQRRKAAQSIGLPPELADQLERLSPDALRALSSEMLDRINSGAFAKPIFPERDAPNPQRRAERVAERARKAPTKAYDTRERSVRTSDAEARQQAKPYLRDYYTNEAGEMVCQACHSVMPFRLADGEHYFEAPELLLSASNEMPENHLALCPTCSAKWRHANEIEDSDLLDAIRASERPELAVTLANEAVRLRFVQVHFDDLKAIFASDDPSVTPH